MRPSCELCGAPAADSEQVRAWREELDEAEGLERLRVLAALVHASRDEVVEGARDLAEEALRLAGELRERDLEHQLHLDLCWILSFRDEVDTALEHAHAAAELASAAEDPSMLAASDYHVALAEWHRGELDAAREAIDRACRSHAGRGEDRELATALTLAGGIHRSTGRFQESLSCHFEALAIAEEHSDDLAVARSRSNIGLLLWQLEQPERALELMLGALELFREVERERLVAVTLNNVGMLYVELGRPAEALPVLSEGLALQRSLGNRRGEAKILGNIGQAHMGLGEHALALEFYERTLQLRLAIGDEWGCATSLARIGRLHNLNGAGEAALASFTQALEHAERCDARVAQAEIHRELAELYRAEGRLEEAVTSLSRHVELEEEINRGEAAKRVTELEAGIQVAAAQHETVAQELELARQRSRTTFLFAGTTFLAIVSAGLFALYRLRTRSIKQLQEANALLMESEHLYRGVFEDAVVPRVLVDIEARQVLEANGQACELWGLDPDDLPGVDIDRLRPAWVSSAIAELGASVDDGGSSRHVEQWIDPDGEPRYAELWTIAMRRTGRPCALITAHDATQSRRRQAELDRLGKLESLGLLAGGIAHDFNNALTAILGKVSLARVRTDEDSDAARLLRESEAAVAHATQLTAQLLAFSKGGAPQLKLQDVSKLVREAVMFGLSGSNVRVDFELADDLWGAELDGGQFKQAISNLVINAAQAMERGGRLIVRTRNKEAQEPLGPEVGPGPYVVIEVQDFGPGIHPEHWDKVLDPYFTTKEGGTGLGLATVYAVVSRHRGWLDFDSEPGHGTLFTLCFPASTLPAPTATESPGPGEVPPVKVLVLDDDPGVQGVYAAALEILGLEHEVVAEGGAALEAWAAAAQAGRPFDVAIMDLTIPGGMGGLEAMRELRRLEPGALGIVSSGYSRDPVMSNYREAGFSAALGKPFTMEELSRVLRDVQVSVPTRVASPVRAAWGLGPVAPTPPRAVRSTGDSASSQPS